MTPEEEVVAGPAVDEVTRRLKAALPLVQRRVLEAMFEKMAALLEDRDRQLAANADIITRQAAELAEARAELERLVRSTGEHITVRSEYLDRARAAEAKLAEAVKLFHHVSDAAHGKGPLSAEDDGDVIDGIADAVADLLSRLTPSDALAASNQGEGT